MFERKTPKHDTFKSRRTNIFARKGTISYMLRRPNNHKDMTKFCMDDDWNYDKWTRYFHRGGDFSSLWSRCHDSNTTVIMQIFIINYTWAPRTNQIAVSWLHGPPSPRDVSVDHNPLVLRCMTLVSPSSSMILFVHDANGRIRTRKKKGSTTQKKQDEKEKDRNVISEREVSRELQMAEGWDLNADERGT